jgi:hypothetical protein
MTKETSSPQTFDSIGWYASELALIRLSKNRQMNVIKLSHNYWHTGSSHRFYTEETVHDASIRKLTKIGDTYLAARPSMWITSEPPRGKKSKRTCKCGVSLQTSG